MQVSTGHVVALPLLSLPPSPAVAVVAVTAAVESPSVAVLSELS